jgi:hypothetical protein
LHGADQNHNYDTCKVILGEIERLKKEKQGRKPSSFSSTSNNQQNTKSTWMDRKRLAASYSTEQLKYIVRMTKKKVMQKAKAKFESQFQEDLHAIEINDDAAQERAKMHEMESFMDNLIDDSESDMEEEEGGLTQAELDELSASLCLTNGLRYAR